MSELGDIYRTFASRAADIRQAAPELHAAMLQWQGREHIPPERHLGPSLTQPGHRDHVFRVLPNEIHFGTRVPYSLYHQAWRQRHGRKSHLRFDGPILQQLADIIGKHVIRGGA